MSDHIAILYTTTDGQTAKICKRLASNMNKNNTEVTLLPLEQFQGELNRFDRIVLGASIRYGVHHQNMIDFIEKNRPILDKVKSAFFSVNLVARKKEKNEPDTNPYVIKFFKSISWRPKIVGVFAGKLDYKKYKFFDRIMIQLIMWMTKGPTDPKTVKEYTDWDKVDEFGEAVLEM